MKFSIAIALCLAAAAPAMGAERACVAPGLGRFYIHTGTGGLLGMFAHEHLIEAKNIQGCAAIESSDLLHSSIKLTFPAADIRVLDPNESASDRAKVQMTMETEVLRVSEYPDIIFESTSIERDGAQTLKVHGNLTIRGHSEAVVIPLMLTRTADGTYRAQGEYKFKQTRFGIKPVQLAGGAIKVKDEVRTEFELFLK